MSLVSLETEILAQLKVIAKNSKLRKKDMMEWSSAKLEPHDGEVIISLPALGVEVAILTELDKRK